MFCKAKPTCRAAHDEALELAKYDFKVADLLSDQEISDVLDKIEYFINWAGSVKEFARAEAILKGKKWPGYKLVEGRSNRKYIDEKKVEEKLLAEGFKLADIYEPASLHGITKIEKLVGKKTFPMLLGDLVVKPSGAPTLVKATDVRPELNSLESAKADFAEHIDTDL